MGYTPIHNRFWKDSWVRELNALDRYLFIYLLTNGEAGLTGIYELPIDIMAAESGIDEKDLRLSMLKRLEPKVYYREGWVIIVNYPKHLLGKGPRFMSGVRRRLGLIPRKIREIAKDYGYPIHTLSVGYRDEDVDEDENISRLASPKRGSSPQSGRLSSKKRSKNMGFKVKDENEHYEEPSIDAESGESNAPQPKTRNVSAERVSRYFYKRAREYTGKSNLVNTGYGVVAKLMKQNKGITEQDLTEVIDQYFDNSPTDRDAANIFKCLSGRSINDFLAERT